MQLSAGQRPRGGWGAALATGAIGLARIDGVFRLERSVGRVGAKRRIKTWQSADFDTTRPVGATQSAGLSLVYYESRKVFPFDASPGQACPIAGYMSR